MKRIIFRRRRAGMISMPAIVSIGLLLTTSLILVLRSQVRSLDAQSHVQLRLDYSQKETAFLRALLHIVPNKAIGAMQRDSRWSADDYSWETIFEEASQLANLEEAIDAAILTQIGESSAIIANSGNTNISSVTDFVAPIYGSSGFVNPGLTQEVSLLFDSNYALNLPAPLATDWSTFRDDEIWPIIAENKQHSASWQEDIMLSQADYPNFNLYQYPNLRFGFARPGETFVAKRNWWAFKLNLANIDEDVTGVASVSKKYVLSIYEIPSQLPLSAAAFMKVGQHADGSSWQNANLSGGVFAGQLMTEGVVELEEGSLSARSDMDLSSSTSIDGRRIEGGFDELGVRERREAETESEFYDASLAGNVGMAAFIPLNRGDEFLTLRSDGSRWRRISPTGWNEYTTGGIQAQMRIRIREMDSVDNQIPTQVRFYYRDIYGNRRYRTYTRGSNWPSDAQTGGTEFPFQTDVSNIGRRALVFHPDRLPTFLASLGDAADVGTNNSIYIYPDSNRHTVNEPNIPSTAADLTVSIRGGEDLSAYTSGFSLVTNLRLYIGSSLNITPVPPPAGSGLSASEDYFPPISLFAPEKRFGESISFSHPIEFTGQVSSLKTDPSDAFRPLDFKSGNDDSVNPNLIGAKLERLKSPAQLPPIHMMNWLIVIEEVF